MITSLLARIGLPVAALALLAFAVVHVAKSANLPQKPAPVVAPPRNPFPHTVAGAGMVEPETENISIGSSVPGVVVAVLAKVGQHVYAGGELFRLDDRQLKAELKWRESAAAAAQAELTRLQNEPRPEQLQMLEAQIAEAQANLADMEDQYRRTKELIERRVAAAESLSIREQAFLAAKAKLARVRTEYEMTRSGAWEFDILVAQAAVTQAQAQVEQTRTELDRLVVRALSAGQVLQVNVRPGEFVGAPPTQALVVLGSVERLHVRVDIDEHDIHRFTPGTPARAMPKGHSQQQYSLEFVRVEPFVVPKKSLTGDNTERVDTRVLQVIYALAPGPQPLYVGQQVDVFIEETQGSQDADRRSVYSPDAGSSSGSSGSERRDASSPDEEPEYTPTDDAERSDADQSFDAPPPAADADPQQPATAADTSEPADDAE